MIYQLNGDHLILIIKTELVTYPNKNKPMIFSR